MELEQMKALLEHLREEHGTLTNAIVALEQYLAIREKAPGATRAIARPEQVPLSPHVMGSGGKPDGEKATVPKGSISIRRAIVDVLKQAGRPMHTTEIWQHAYARGARTAAKRPDAIVALSAYGIDGVEKVGPRTFVWHEFKDNQLQP